MVLIQSDGSTSSVSSTLTLGTADISVTTIIEDINYFIIPAGQTVNTLGKFEIKAVGIVIEEGATFNGSGGGYAGAAGIQEFTRAGRGQGAGGGQGGIMYGGGAGAGHGKLFNGRNHSLFVMNLCFLLYYNTPLNLPTGGQGGNGGQHFNTYQTLGGSSDDTTLPSFELGPGSGGGGSGGRGRPSEWGGDGGAGGSAIRLFAKDIVLDGSILVNGEDGETV